MHHYLWHINEVNLCLPEAGLFFSRNLTPYNQKLTWKCRELKHTGKVCSSWSSKGVIKLRHTMNEDAIAIEDKIELSDLDPDFIFLRKEKTGCRYFIQPVLHQFSSWFSCFPCFCSSRGDLWVDLFLYFSAFIVYLKIEDRKSTIYYEKEIQGKFEVFQV